MRIPVSFSRGRWRSSAAWGAALLGAVASSTPAEAGTRITTEGVDQYVPNQCGWGGALNNRVANNNGFRAGMVTGDGRWTAGANFANSSVWDRDMYDPERTGNPLDNDTNNFDRAGDGIAFFSGHGICDGATTTLCTSSTQCNSPPPGASMPSSCKQGPPGSGFPPIGQGWCHYFTPRRAFTCSTSSAHNNDVNYTGGQVKFGESANSGGWSGAGTNGGVNMAILDVSCGVLPQFAPQQLSQAFAGVHLIGTIMPVTGDTADVANRGSAFAARWASNEWQSVAGSWIYVVLDLGGANCSGGGINGCGCNWVQAQHATWADWYVNTESWVGVKLDSNDATSSGWWAGRQICNYNQAQYPYHLP